MPAPRRTRILPGRARLSSSGRCCRRWDSGARLLARRLHVHEPPHFLVIDGSFLPYAHVLFALLRICNLCACYTPFGLCQGCFFTKRWNISSSIQLSSHWALLCSSSKDQSESFIFFLQNGHKMQLQSIWTYPQLLQYFAYLVWNMLLPRISLFEYYYNI